MITREELLELKFIEQVGPLLTTYSINVANFPEEFKTISCTIEPGNQYVYLRQGDLKKPREKDDVVTIFNSDTHGPLTMSTIELLLKLADLMTAKRKS